MMSTQEAPGTEVAATLPSSDPAPRIYFMPTLAACRPERFAQARRLHFNWLGLPLAPFYAAEPAISAAAAVGLKVMASVDAIEIEAMRAAELALKATAVGVSGVRCAGAHRLAPHWWVDFLSTARSAAPELLWILDSLGAPADSTAQLLDAGFDYVFSSV